VTNRILVVDDDREMCDLLDGALRRRGFEVETRTAADQAFALLADGDFDVVVIDLQMKGMNGLELCERITQNRPGRHRWWSTSSWGTKRSTGLLVGLCIVAPWRAPASGVAAMLITRPVGRPEASEARSPRQRRIDC
jgi:CheY-like chemotaxis protein